MRVEEFNVKMFKLNDLFLGIATDFGPRILFLSSTKKPEYNLFNILPEFGVKTEEGFWKIYGGHRLWISPESKPRSYSLDNKPVKIEEKNGKIIVYGNPEPKNFIQKKIIIKASSNNRVEVIHEIKNIGRWPIKFACWALSVMRKNGFAIIPIKPLKVDLEGLLPDRHITLWPYTNLSDKRIIFTNEYIFVKQDPSISFPIKIGTMPNPAWTAYWVDNMLFIKYFIQEKEEYPDYGCSTEVYTNADFLELETLGPLKIVNSSESIQHAEIWSVYEIGELAPEADQIKEKVEPIISRGLIFHDMNIQ